MSIQHPRTSRTSIFGACMLAATLAIAGSAVAQSDNPETTVSVKVSYGDLNLASEAGASAMLARIEHAAGRACGDAPNLSDLGGRALYNQCRAGAIARGVEALGAPLVTALAGQPSARVALTRR